MLSFYIDVVLTLSIDQQEVLILIMMYVAVLQ